MIGSVIMITHIIVESPTVGIKLRVDLKSSFMAIHYESNHLRKKGTASLSSWSSQHNSQNVT